MRSKINLGLLQSSATPPTNHRQCLRIAHASRDQSSLSDPFKWLPVHTVGSNIDLLIQGRQLQCTIDAEAIALEIKLTWP